MKLRRMVPVMLGLVFNLSCPAAEAELFGLNDRGYVIVEAENLPHSGDWEFVPKGDNKRIMGRGFLRYVGPVTGKGHGQEIDEDGRLQPAEEHWIKIPVQIDEPGRYRVNIRNHHLKKDGDNDIWVHLMGAPPPIRRVGDHAVESFQWLTWGTEWVFWDIEKPGVYTFYLAGRSRGFGVDRIAVYNESAPITMFHRVTPAVN
ncbi:MAG: hypothetical protein SynsKO_40920 [Synoicihabitans sp.]